MPGLQKEDGRSSLAALCHACVKVNHLSYCEKRFGKPEEVQMPVLGGNTALEVPTSARRDVGDFECLLMPS